MRTASPSYSRTTSAAVGAAVFPRHFSLRRRAGQVAVFPAAATRAGHDREQTREPRGAGHEARRTWMTFTTSHLMLDLSALPFHSAELNDDFR